MNINPPPFPTQLVDSIKSLTKSYGTSILYEPLFNGYSVKLGPNNHAWIRPVTDKIFRVELYATFDLGLSLEHAESFNQSELIPYLSSLFTQHLDP